MRPVWLLLLVVAAANCGFFDQIRSKVKEVLSGNGKIAETLRNSTMRFHKVAEEA